MHTAPEEADTIIEQHVVNVPSQKAELLQMILTYVFVSLLHFCYHKNITSHVMMVSPIQGLSND